MCRLINIAAAHDSSSFLSLGRPLNVAASSHVNSDARGVALKAWDSSSLSLSLFFFYFNISRHVVARARATVFAGARFFNKRESDAKI